jgi:hypothetical protein
VYGVVAADAPHPEGSGLDEQPLRLLIGDGVGAIVSDIAGSEPAFGRAGLTAHSEVLEAALAATTVLPMRFGVVMEGDDAVRADLLDRHRAALEAQLHRLAGRVELTLRATYEEAPLLREIMATEPAIRAMHAGNSGSYIDQVRLGEMIAGAVAERRRRDAEEMLTLLAPLADDYQLAEPRHERMAMSASFLITREGMPQFDAAVDDIGRRQQHRMRLRYTGPLPPHSFVNLEGVS